MTDSDCSVDSRGHAHPRAFRSTAAGAVRTMARPHRDSAGDSSDSGDGRDGDGLDSDADAAMCRRQHVCIPGMHGGDKHNGGKMRGQGSSCDQGSSCEQISSYGGKNGGVRGVGGVLGGAAVGEDRAMAVSEEAALDAAFFATVTLG